MIQKRPISRFPIDCPGLQRACGLLFLAGVLATAGCRQKADSTRQTGQGPFIGFVGTGQDDPLWPVLQASAERYLDLFADLDVRFVAPPRSSPGAQIRIIRDLLAQNVSALCIQVEDPELLEPAIVAAFKQGVPVYTMVRDAAQRFRSAFIGFDEEEIGRVLAETTLNSIDGQGVIALIHAGPEHPAFGARYRLFERTIRDQGRIRILKRLDCRADPRTAKTMLRDTLQRYPNLKAVVLLANWPFMVDSDEPYEVPDTCRILSVGATPEYWKYLEEGSCFALIGFEYEKIGFGAMQYAATARLPGQRAPRLKLDYIPARVVWATTLPSFKADWFEWTSRPVPDTHN